MTSAFSQQNCLPLPCFILYSKAKFACYSRYLLNSYFYIPVPYDENSIFFGCQGFLSSSVSKTSACNAGGLGSIPRSGRSPGEGRGNPLQYSCLENPTNKGAWQATVHGSQESDTTQCYISFLSLGVSSRRTCRPSQTTIQLQLLLCQWLGTDLNYCDIEWFALETNRGHSVIFEIEPKYCILDSC